MYNRGSTSKMKRLLTMSLVCLGILFLPGIGFGEPAPELNTQPKVEKVTALPNPTGMEFGFWPNYRLHDSVFQDFGKRTTSRIEIRGWKSIEKDKGQYDWNGVFDHMKQAHRYGQTPIISINISFSSQITTNTTIPDFYYQRITNPETREAAKQFLYAYVQELLNQVGSVKLAIDYEIVSNYKLHEDYSGTRKAEWRDWYIEAAAVARQAAADLGKADQLKLIPIVNGNPFKVDSAFYGGASNNQWLLDVLAVSDYLGLDIYQLGDPEGPEQDVTDPKMIFEHLQFFIDQYAEDVDVIMVENGFSTVTETDPDITWRAKGKYAGTEAQQEAYYTNLFEELQEANKPGGVLQNKLRGFHFWSYSDNTNDEGGKGAYERYFGLVRSDGTHKPALDVVRDGINQMEDDPFYSPVILANTEDVTDSFVQAGASGGIDVRYTNGNDYEYLKVELSPKTSKLTIVTEQPGYLLANVNNQDWLSQTDTATTEFQLDLENYKQDETPIEVKLYFTGDVFPFEQKVKSISVPIAENLLTNAGFELGDLSSWSISGDPTRFTLDEGNARTGKYALKISGPQQFHYVFQPFDVVPGAEYLLTFYARGSANFIYRVTGPPLVEKVDTQNSIAEWKKYTLRFTAPTDQTTLRLDFTDVPGIHTVYVDDVNIHQLSSAKEITSFGFPALGVAGTMTGKNIMVHVPHGTDVTQLVANFTFSNQATVTVGTAGQTSEVTANDFSAPVAYTVKAEDGSTAVYTVTVNVLPPASATLVPIAATFDKHILMQKDVSITLTDKGHEFIGINNDAASLTRGTDYTVSGQKVTISKQYLATLPVGTTMLTFDMSAGTDPVLTVTVTESAMLVASIAISGPDTLIIPLMDDTSSHTAQFQAVVKNQFNQEMTGETVTWSLAAPALGVTIDAATGIVSLSSTAVSGSDMILRATANANSQIKAEYQVFLADAGTPYWPIGSKLTAGQIGTDFINVTWPAARDDKGIAKYELYQVLNTTQAIIDEPYSYSVTENVYSSLITGLTPDTSYTFKVKAFDHEDNSTGAGLTTTLKMSADTTSPVWPTNKSIIVTNISESGVTLKWSRVLDEQAFEEYAIVKDGVDVTTVGIDVDEYMLEGLAAGTAYEIRIEAVAHGGNRNVDGPFILITLPDNSGLTASTSYTVGTTDNATVLAADEMLHADAIVTNHLLISRQVLAVVALYDSDGAMADISYLSVTLNPGEIRTLHTGFKLPSDITGHQVKTFIWDGTDPLNSNANPISAASMITG